MGELTSNHLEQRENALDETELWFNWGTKRSSVPPGGVLGEHRVAKLQFLEVCKLTKADCKSGRKAAVV